jgi:7-carboxy-7-deazaguanine synthase
MSVPYPPHRLALLQRKAPGTLLIHEIYKSLQGESTFAGLPCVFVRTAVCGQRCVWCFVPETPILMADWSWRQLADLQIGDEVMGFAQPGPRTQKRLVTAQITHLGTRQAPTVRVNGQLRCTEDHKFWLTGEDQHGRHNVHNGWREVSRAVGQQVSFLTEPRGRDQSLYERGWLAGMADGDGTFWTLKHRRGYRRFRLALKDVALLKQTACFAERAGFPLRSGVHFHAGFSSPERMSCLWLTKDKDAIALEALLSHDVDHPDWHWGYLGGILDAEGSLSGRIFRIAQSRTVNPRVWTRIGQCLDALGLKYTVERSGFYLHRRHGQIWSILSNARPAKESIRRFGRWANPRSTRVIEQVESTGHVETVVTLSTSTGNFVAAGYLVKNCDTPHAFTEGEEMSPDEVLRRVRELDCPLVEVTGGEPLLQPEIFPLMTALADAEMTVLLETSGAEDVSRVDRRVHIIMDLKCPDSGECERNLYENLDRLKAADQVKFVIASRRDFDWTVETVRRHRLDERFVVLLSAVFDRVPLADLAAWLLDSGLNVRMQIQMHKYIWDPKARGV